MTAFVDKFVYHKDTASIQWPLFVQRLEIVLAIQNVGIVIQQATEQPQYAGETTAKAFNVLLHTGDTHVIEIYNAIPVPKPTSYPALLTYLNTHFAAVNPMVADYQFRAAKQGQDESLTDYATRLKGLATQAAIPADTINLQVLSVIRSSTTDHDVRIKCLEATATLAGVLEWKSKLDITENCAATMEAVKSTSNILAIKNLPNISKADPDRLCYACGDTWPHPKDIPCKALGKTCSKCNRLNHFAKMCRDGQPRNATNVAPARTRQSNSQYGRSNQQGQTYGRFNSSSARSQNNGRSNSYGRSTSFRDTNPPNNRIRNINDLSSEDVIKEFEEFYRRRQSEDDNDDNTLIRSISQTSDYLKIELINELTAAQLEKCPRTFIEIGKRKILHLVDTGTNLNILTKSTYQSLAAAPMLQPTKIKAYGYTSKSSIPLLGEFYAKIKFKHRFIHTKFIVLDGEAENILGYTAATLLGIVKITCDMDPNVTNAPNSQNITINSITPYHPEANSGAERIMKGQNKRARCAQVANTNWKSEYTSYLHRYNQTPHSATLVSPNMLLFGSDKCDILPQLVKRTLNNKIRQQAKDNDTAAKARMKYYADQYQQTKHRHFKINDPLLHLWIRQNKHQPLFDPHPYRVSKLNGNMITASRSNHQLTRNAKKFKIISEKCYEQCMHLLTERNKPRRPINIPSEQQQILHQDVGAPPTPPPTPDVNQQFSQLQQMPPPVIIPTPVQIPPASTNPIIQQQPQLQATNAFSNERPKRTERFDYKAQSVRKYNKKLQDNQGV